VRIVAKLEGQNPFQSLAALPDTELEQLVAAGLTPAQSALD
jgi:hypothetical protein